LKNKNSILAATLVICLVAAVIFALLSDSGSNRRPPEHPGESVAVYISEICSKNKTIIADSDGKFRDYVELYNPGAPVDLAGFRFTDGKGTSEPLGHIILGTGEYRVFFLSAETTGFSLGSSGGDCVQLLDPWGDIVTQANTASCTVDQVMADQNGAFLLSDEASPNFPNTPEGVKAFREGSPAQAPALVISEVLISNTAALPDEQGIFSDVIELHNTSDEPVYLGSWFLSDAPDWRFSWRLPDITLAPDAYLVIFCDGMDYISQEGQIHANFRISHGETLVLTDGTGAWTQVLAESQDRDLSQSLTGDGPYVPGLASLGYPNTDEGVSAFQASVVDPQSPLVISEVLLSGADVPWDGAFTDVVEIWNRSGETVSTDGWYLSDGSDPYSYPLDAGPLAPGQRLVITCAPKATGFSLSAGESVMLLSPTHRFAPVVVCPEPGPGMSISLVEDAEDIGFTFSPVTLGFENTDLGHSQYRQAQMSPGLIISELMSANTSFLKGAYATTSDWIELFNSSDNDIHLADYCLSDDADQPDKYPLPDMVLAPGKYCVIFLNSDPRNLLSGYPVLPFSLSSQGDQLYLTRENTVIDHVFIPSIPKDMSYGRAPGAAVFSLLSGVTPGAGNSAQAEISAVPTVQTPQGSYDDTDGIEVVLSAPGTIYYTTDATAPTTADQVYTGPIRLTSTTVLRVMSQEPGKLPSEVVDLTYLLNENTVLPAVTLVVEPDDLWSSHSGIYISGPGISSEPPFYGANFWKDWEKEATLSLFETNGEGFSTKCGIKIFGAFTRVLPKKSLACFFRDIYGSSELTYPVFGEGSLDTYESLVLRSAGQDAFKGRMRDVVLTSLLGEATDVPIQQYKPVVVFINGEYWGLHYIREKLNENYVAGHYNVPAGSVTVVEGGGWTSPEYRELVDYVLKHDMSQQVHYDYVCSQIDVDNYIDMYIAQMWIANTDNGNVKYFRIGDGKWTWFFYDTDLSLEDEDLNTVRNNLTTAGLDRSDYIGRTFAAKMLSHPEFRDKFLTRLAWQMNNIWTEENLLSRIEELEAVIQPIMERECVRWNRSYSDWEAQVRIMKNFAKNRNGYMLIYIQSFFQLSDAEMRDYGFDI